MKGYITNLGKKENIDIKECATIRRVNNLFKVYILKGDITIAMALRIICSNCGGFLGTRIKIFGKYFALGWNDRNDCT